MKVGGDVVSYCTKCRMDLNHTIHAIVDKVPVRVECNTCHGIHKYHAPKEAKEPRPKATASVTPSITKASSVSSESKPASSRASNKAPVVDPADTWIELIKDKHNSAKPYAMNTSFSAGDVIDHPTFGLGYVEKRLAPQKISVFFRDGAKSLVDGR